MLALWLLVLVTAIWGITFVQVKDALALYPLFAFLALRFAIASATLAVPGRRTIGSLGRDGWRAGIVLGLMVLVVHTAVLRRHVGGVDHVLDADGNAIERSRRAAFAAALVGSAGSGADMLGIEVNPGLHIGLALGDALYEGIGIGECGQLTSLHATRGFGGGEV